jgi:hypothetical protein
VTTAVVDISRAWPSTEENLVSKAREFAEQASGQSPLMVILGFDHHRDVIGELDDRTTFRSLGASLPEEAVVVRLAEVLKDLAADGPGKVIVFSFHPQVIGKLGELAEVDMDFEVQSLNGFVRKPAAAVGWPQNFVPLDAAIELLSAALRKHGKTSPANWVHKTSLRQLLTLEDPRFAKGSSPASETPKLITILLDEATSRGVVRSEGKDPQVRVWAPGSVVVPKQATQSGIDQVGEPETRSQHFIRSLKESEFGPFADLRLKVYDAIEYTLKESPGLNETELLRRAVEKVRVDGPAEFVRPDRSIPRDKFPWKKLRDFVRKLLRCRPVLLGEDGTPFVPSWQTLSTPVYGLALDWQLQLEGELMIKLISCCDDIRYDDVEDLVGALLATRNSENTQRIQHVLGDLMAKNRVGFDPETESLRVIRIHPEPVTA